MSIVSFEFSLTFVFLKCWLFRNYKFLLAFEAQDLMNLMNANCSHYFLQQVLRENMAISFYLSFYVICYHCFFKIHDLIFMKISFFQCHIWTFLIWKLKTFICNFLPTGLCFWTYIHVPVSVIEIFSLKYIIYLILQCHVGHIGTKTVFAIYFIIWHTDVCLKVVLKCLHSVPIKGHIFLIKILPAK